MLQTTTCLYLLLWLALPTSVISQTGTSFTEVPVSQTVNIQENALFRCKHSTADTFRWKVNETRLRGSMLPPGILPSNHLESGSLVQTLTVVGHQEYNGTRVVCVANFDDGSQPQETETAVLYVTAMVPISTFSTNFVIQPSQAIIPVMTEANFYCHIPNAFIVWSVNGTRLDDEFYPPNITTSNGHLFSNNRIDRLTMLARPEYNGTSIECGGFYLNNSTRHPNSPSVKLLIQGRLSAVKNIKRTPVNATISWIAPLSLNLTNAEPDIAYCVKVYNITCGLRALLVNTCSVFEPFYVNNSTLNKADIFEISVTPQSNVENALRGIEETITEQYIYFNDTAISPDLRKTSSDTVDVQVHLNTEEIQDRIAPDSFVVSLESINGTILRNFSANTIILTESLVINILGVPYGDIWICNIYATRCDGISVSDITTLSTFDIQNVAIFAGNNSSSIFVECKIINGSEASGILVIAFSTTDASDIHYKVSPSNDQQKIQAVLSCLPGKDYQLVLYVLNETGLPLRRPAMLPSTRQLNKGESYDNQTQCIQEKTIKYKIYTKDEEVCVECNSTCVVIVHQNIALLNTTGELLNIHSTRVIKQTTRNAIESVNYTCIPGINLNEYQIGVTPLIPGNGVEMSLKPGKDLEEDKNLKLIVQIIPAIASYVVIAAAVAITIVCIAVIVNKNSNSKLAKAKAQAIPNSNESGGNIAVKREQQSHEAIVNTVASSPEGAPIPEIIVSSANQLSVSDSYNAENINGSHSPALPLQGAASADNILSIIPDTQESLTFTASTSNIDKISGKVTPRPVSDFGYESCTPASSTAGSLNPIPLDSPLNQHAGKKESDLLRKVLKDKISGKVTPRPVSDFGYESCTPASSTAGSLNPIPLDSPFNPHAGKKESDLLRKVLKVSVSHKNSETSC